MKRSMNDNNTDSIIQDKTKKSSDPKDDEQRKYRLIIVILLLVTIVSVIVAVCAIFGRNKGNVQSESSSVLDYAPVPIEANVQPLPPEEDSDTDSSASSASKASIVYSDEVTLSLSEREAEIMVQDPARSTQDMVVSLTIDGKIIAESERIPAGYELLKLENADTDKLVEGTYEGKFIITYYDSLTAERAVVNSEIPVRITVTK